MSMWQHAGLAASKCLHLSSTGSHKRAAGGQQRASKTCHQLQAHAAGRAAAAAAASSDARGQTEAWSRLDETRPAACPAVRCSRAAASAKAKATAKALTPAQTQWPHESCRRRLELVAGNGFHDVLRARDVRGDERHGDPGLRHAGQINLGLRCNFCSALQCLPVLQQVGALLAQERVSEPTTVLLAKPSPQE